MIIGGKFVDQDSRVLIIAEVGINHDGKLEQALQLIDVAAEAGADVVKFQLFTAEKMYTKFGGQYKTANGTMVDINALLKDMELPISWLPTLQSYAAEKGLGFLCTACDTDGADLLEAHGADAFKMAAAAVAHIPLLQHVARKGKPVVMSTGGAFLPNIDDAVCAMEAEGNDRIALMHCVVKYPTPLEDCNLKFIQTLKLLYPDYIIGYSDHTEDPVLAPVAAVVMGAKIVEKHITPDKSLPGADHSFAVTPDQLKEMVAAIRETERKLAAGETVEVDPRVLGSSRKRMDEAEVKSRNFGYRTIFATADMKRGDKISTANTDILRPGQCERGIDPKYWQMLMDLGACVNKDLELGRPIRWQDVLYTEQ